MTVRAMVVAGGNAGDVRENLRRAEAMIGERVGRVVARSSVRESEPWGDVAPEQGAERASQFLNQAFVVETPLEPEALLDALQGIETLLGRVRGGGGWRDDGAESDEGTVYGESGGEGERGGRDVGGYVGDGGRRYESRTMDLDILFYGDAVIGTERLTIPHPLLHRRRFVLEPLAEIAPAHIDPVSGKSVEELLKELL